MAAFLVIPSCLGLRLGTFAARALNSACLGRAEFSSKNDPGSLPDLMTRSDGKYAKRLLEILAGLIPDGLGTILFWSARG